MNHAQAQLTHLVSRLPIKINKCPRKFRGNVDGLYSRLLKMRSTVTALVRHERIELNYPRADEARGYAERLIADAVRYGDCHKPTMEQAKFWLEDPALVPKLFKVLAPRYQNWSSGVPLTRLLRAPSSPTDIQKYEPMNRAVLELRGNPYPPLPGPTARQHPGHIHNVLLEEARKDYFKSQSALAQQAETTAQAVPDDESSHLEDVDPEEIRELENANIIAPSLKNMSLEEQSPESAPSPGGKQ